MHKLVLVNVLAVIATVFCYDFEDSYYNQILATDLEETQDSLDDSNVVEHPRARRDEEAVGSFDKCRRRRFRECCDTAFMANQHNEEREYKRQCFKEIYAKDKDAQGPAPDPFKCDKVHKHKKDMTCFLQCLAQKKNLVDKDGNVKEAQFTAYARDSFKESWLVSHLDTIIPKCLAEARNATANHGKNDSDSCNPAAIKGAHCLFREIQMNCPEDQIKDAKTCSKFKERVKKHEELLPTSQRLEE